LINRIDFFNVKANKFPQKTNNDPQNPQPVAVRGGQVGQYASAPRMSASYFIPFLGKKDYTENEKEFFNLKKQLSRKEHKKVTELGKTEWDSYIYSSDENSQKFNDAFADYMELASDKGIFEKLKNINESGVSDPKLAKSLKKMLKDYTNNVANADDIMLLQEREQEISDKFNSSRGEIDGKTYSNAQLAKMMKEEMNVDMRKKIYDAKEVQNGELIAKDLVDLVKQRNEFAKKNGYDNYFSYELKENYEVDEKKLFELLDDLDKKTDKVYNKINDKNDKKLADAFGIKPKDLKPWHYGLQLEDSPVKEADKYIKNDEMLTEVAFDMYKKMGWDIPKLPIMLDLFPKENKNQHGFCFEIDKNKDVRILANLTNDVDSLETLNHELGHAVYDTGVSEHLPYYERDVASTAMTEAVAMLMESLPYREGSFEDSLNMPKDLTKKLEDKRCEGLVRFVRRYNMFINFEKEMYKNPDQDLPKLWYKLEKKYMNKNNPDKLNNTWATVPHFLSCPAYLQNYLRAEIMGAQIYETATGKLGPLTKNDKTADYFRTKMFRHGSSLTEDELIKKMTGKELSVEPFCKQFESLEVDK